MWSCCLHPDNVTSSPEIMREFLMAVERLGDRLAGFLISPKSQA